MLSLVSLLLAVQGVASNADPSRNPNPPVENFHVVGVGLDSITLSWTTPIGNDTGSGIAAMYELLHSTQPFPEGDPDAIVEWMLSATAVNGLPLPGEGGATEEFTVSGLTPGTTYHFALRYYTLIGSSDFVSTSGSTETEDSGPPSTIQNLAVISAGEESLTLEWTAPGSNPDGLGTAAGYDLRTSTAPITEATFASATPVANPPAPLPGGMRQRFSVGGLTAGVVHHVALRSRDAQNQWSAVSNSVSGLPLAKEADEERPSPCGGSAPGTLLPLLPILLALALGCSRPAGGAGPEAVAGAATFGQGALTWTDSDWSGGGHAAAAGVDPAASPGELVLESDPADMVPFLQTVPSEWPTLRKSHLFSFTTFSREPGRLYFGISSTLDGGWNGGGENQDISELHFYDLETDSARNVGFSRFEFRETAVLRMREHNGRIYVPSNDNLDSGTLQNLHIYDPAVGWRQNLSVISTYGGHLGDIAFFQGRIYVCGGAGSYPSWGEMHVSSDGGSTFTAVEPVPSSLFQNSGCLRGMAVFDGTLFVKSSIGDTVFRFDGTTWSTLRIPGFVAGYEPQYAEFEVWRDKLWLLWDRHVASFDAATDAWSYVSEAPVVEYDTAPMGFRGVGEQLYVAGMVPPVEGRLRESQLWRSLHGSGPWELVDPELAPPEDFMRMRMIRSWHGRIFVSDGRTPNVRLHPRLHAARCEGAGTLDSAVHDFGLAVSSGTIAWSGIRPPGTTLRFQVRSGATAAELAGRPFAGPDGSPLSHYLAPSALGPAHAGRRCFQYRAFLDGADGGRLTPILQEVTISGTPGSGPKLADQ